MSKNNPFKNCPVMYSNPFDTTKSPAEEFMEEACGEETIDHKERLIKEISMEMEYVKVDLTTSRSLPVYRGFCHTSGEVWLSTVRLDPHVIEGIKQAVADGHWMDFPYGYYLCFFKEEKKGNLDMFPLPLVLETPNDKLPTDWLRYCKLKLEEALA